MTHPGGLFAFGQVSLLALLLAAPAWAGKSSEAQILWKLSTAALSLDATDYISGLAIDGAGTVAAVGNRLATNEAVVVRISSAGAVLRTDIVTGSVNGVAADPAGNFYVAGASGGSVYVRKYMPDGSNFVLVSRAGGTWTSVAFQGGALYTGGSDAGGRFDLVRIDPAAGGIIWSRSNLGAFRQIKSLAADDAGTVYVRTAQDITCWSQAGTPAWSVARDTGAYATDGTIRQYGGHVYTRGNDASGSYGSTLLDEMSAATGVRLRNITTNTAATFVVLADGSFVFSGASGPICDGWADEAENLAVYGTARWSVPFPPYPFYGLAFKPGQALAASPRGMVIAAGSLNEGVVAIVDPLSSNGPKKGKLVIRNNVIRIKQGTVARIAVGEGEVAKVLLEVYDASGHSIGDLGTFMLGSDKRGVAFFDGKIGGRPLRTGVYWIVAREGVTDRQPVVVINE